MARRSAHVGQRVSFDASKSDDPAGRPLSFRWRLGDGTTSETPRLDHTFATAGFYRVGVTATNGGLSDLGSCDVFVVADGPELGTEEAAKRWDWVDPQSKVRFADDDTAKLVGRSSVRADVNPYGGGRVWLRYPLAAAEVIDPTRKSRLEFWVRAENQNIPCWQDANPIVTLSGPDDATRRFCREWNCSTRPITRKPGPAGCWFGCRSPAMQTGQPKDRCPRRSTACRWGSIPGVASRSASGSTGCGSSDRPHDAILFVPPSFQTLSIRTRGRSGSQISGKSRHTASAKSNPGG